MCLNFLSFLSASLVLSLSLSVYPSSSPLSYSPSRSLRLPPLSLSLPSVCSFSTPTLTSLSFSLCRILCLLSSSLFRSLSSSLCSPPTLDTHTHIIHTYVRICTHTGAIHNAHYTNAYSYTATQAESSRSLRCIVVTDDPYQVRIHAGTCIHDFDRGYTVLCVSRTDWPSGTTPRAVIATAASTAMTTTATTTTTTTQRFAFSRSQTIRDCVTLL